MTAQTVTLPRGAKSYLQRRDPALGAVMRKVGAFTLSVGSAEGELESLTRAIVSQQLSTKAAATIYGRLRALFAPERFPTAEELAAVDEVKLRGVGLSGQKVSYLKDLAAKAESLQFASMRALDDEAVISRLTQVKGFGRWSAEMFLIFHLGRLDVWPIDDLGVRKAVGLIHEHEELPGRLLMEETGALYRPYRTVAAWYLWRSLG